MRQSETVRERNAQRRLKGHRHATVHLFPYRYWQLAFSDSRIGLNTFGWFLHLNFGLSCVSSFRLFSTGDWTDSLPRGQDAFITGMSHPASLQYKRLFALVISTVVDVHFTPGTRYLSWTVYSPSPRAQESHCILISLIDITSGLLGSTLFFHTV